MDQRAENQANVGFSIIQTFRVAEEIRKTLQKLSSRLKKLKNSLL